MLGKALCLHYNLNEDFSEAELQIVGQHHERQDGTGYPAGLMGENIIPNKDNTLIVTPN